MLFHLLNIYNFKSNSYSIICICSLSWIVGVLFLGTFELSEHSLKPNTLSFNFGVEVPFSKIVINLPRTYRKLHCKQRTTSVQWLVRFFATYTHTDRQKSFYIRAMILKKRLLNTFLLMFDNYDIISFRCIFSSLLLCNIIIYTPGA